MEITKPTPIQTTQNVTVTQTGMPSPISTTTMTPTTNTTTTTTSTTTATTSPSTTPTPTLTFYYGGQPNQMANQIFITTSDPEQSTEAIATTMLLDDSSSPELHRTWNEKRTDANEFKPSVQYENDPNYRYAIDTHFVPITSPSRAHHPLRRLLQNNFLPAGAPNASVSLWKVQTR